MSLRFVIIFCIVLTKSLSVNAQVNLNTGAAEYSLPLYSYSDPANRLNTNLSLRYVTGNGLKVSDVGSSVGTGWQLDFGGSITRIQAGEPDDQKVEGSFNSTPINGANWLNYLNNYYPNGYMYSEFNPGDPVNNGGGYIPLFPLNYFGKYKQPQAYLADREQDKFMFSFNGRQGYFIIGKNGQVVTLVDSKLKIEFEATDMTADKIITRISAFHITDETGVRYTFRELELNQMLEYERILPDGGWGYPVYAGTVPSETRNILKGIAKDLFVVGKWHLSEIKNPLSGKKIEFEYEDIDIDMPGFKTGLVSYTDGRSDRTLMYERIKGISKRLMKIKCSASEEVIFRYSTSLRQDLLFDRTLEQIDVKYGDLTKYSWKMTYGYFVGDQIKDATLVLTQAERFQARLCLKTIQKHSQNENKPVEPPYLFDYYVGYFSYTLNSHVYADYGTVSPLYNFYRDQYGFPKHDGDNIYLYQDRSDGNYDDVDWDDIEQYAYNDLFPRNPSGIRWLCGALRKVKNPLGGELSFLYEGNFATKNASTQSVLMGGGRVGKTILFDGISHDNDIVQEYKYLREDGFSSGWGYEDQIFRKTREQTVFRCSDQRKPGLIIKAATSTLPGFFTRHIVQTMMGGNVLNVASLSQPVMQAFAVGILVYILNEVFTPPDKTFDVTEGSMISATEANSLPCQYSRVEVVNKLGSGTTGSAIYEFTSALDPGYEIDVPTLAVANSQRPRFPFWAYGLPKTVLIKDKDNNNKQKTVYEYDLIKNTLNNSNFVSQKWTANKMTYNCSYTYSGGSSNSGDIDHDVYYPMTGRISLGKKTEFLYNQNGEFVSNSTNYTYSPTNFQLKSTKAGNSKGELIETTIYYPDDYTLTGIIETMRSNEVNMLNIPIASQTFITKPGNQKYLLAGSVSDYTYAPNGDIKSFKTFVARSENPPSSSLVEFNDNQLIPGANIYEETGSVVFSDNGLPLQVNSDKGKICYIYDYDKSIAVATVLNADADDVAYTSFESNGLGGWTFDPSMIYQDFAPTGKKVFRFSKGGAVISKTINSNKHFILSFWSKGATPFISGATAYLRRSFLNTSTGYTYYEYEISNGSLLKIDNSNNGTIGWPYPLVILDELRLYTKEAEMSTITIDPLIGKTSESDTNGRITYYEYDEAGRLKLVKDQFRNVITAYEYNHKQ